MKRNVILIGLLGLLAILFTAPALAAEGSAEAGGAGGNWYVYLSYFAMAIATSVCAISQSKAISAACDSVSRNPGAADSIRFFLILGLVLIESLALYTLLIIFAK
ncbi:MAG TPA: ATP synthase F0 subunit C [Acidobacteriota bacterium]|nr:ATP synthase F0 subunit C [Acidobacteriota bacterium]HOT00246.1 ATP synthase F0 subunit C [Acidobacteriota bacterium]HQF86522.1 ATP synthase F0 subunit C [Acidobacteriota bacterium]HQG90226.1 ATP synthase F0 subunit C [Acidobacteriota bacterium]HQK85989.1 ATP synthase F0 subunit C [Acidobacteriota bacterium]